MFGVHFTEERSPTTIGTGSGPAVLYTAFAWKLIEHGIMLEPDSREPWFLCEAHQDVDLSWLESLASQALREALDESRLRELRPGNLGPEYHQEDDDDDDDGADLHWVFDRPGSMHALFDSESLWGSHLARARVIGHHVGSSTDELLNISEIGRFALLAKSDRNAGTTGSTGTPNPMNIAL